MKKTLWVAFPRGFCAGVRRAIEITEKCLDLFGAPIYVNHEIVHNQFVVQQLQKKGVIFTEDIDAVPENSTYIFSAHGVSPQFREKAKSKKLRIIDATCPLVSKVHSEAEMFHSKGYEILYIGQKNHQETQGTTGIALMKILETLTDIEQIDATLYEGKLVACLTQTTLSVNDTKAMLDALKEKIPHLRTPGDICYATTNRQKAMLELCQKCEAVIVVGSRNSSNSNKLVHLAHDQNLPAILIDQATDIPKEYFEFQSVGLSSGASVPESLVQEVIVKFKQKIPALSVQELPVCEEKVLFPLPSEVL
ncbi:4-hydroxy-3-methylbut-2-enyl diphosphate reductase [Candidatus Gracilibacteria bacterium]|nr:4-hydroxy-3-methylbut-2-enyl diphosphate reductase [Candidatus Gracilibacteria bacterium]